MFDGNPEHITGAPVLPYLAGDALQEATPPPYQPDDDDECSMGVIRLWLSRLQGCCILFRTSSIYRMAVGISPRSAKQDHTSLCKLKFCVCSYMLLELV